MTKHCEEIRQDFRRWWRRRESISRCTESSELDGVHLEQMSGAMVKGSEAPRTEVEAPGIEPRKAPVIVEYSGVSEGDTPRTHPEDSPKPPPMAHVSAHVEDALAEALRGAAAAGRWDVVAQLAGELAARRLASAGNVTPIGKRGGK